MLSRSPITSIWMSRYLERAEHTARLIDVNLALDLERSPEARGQYWVRVLQSLQTAPPATGSTRTGYPPSDLRPEQPRLGDRLHLARDGPRTGSTLYKVTRHLTFDQSNPASVVACILAAWRTRARCASRSAPKCGSRSTAFT